MFAVENINNKIIFFRKFEQGSIILGITGNVGLFLFTPAARPSHSGIAPATARQHFDSLTNHEFTWRSLSDLYVVLLYTARTLLHTKTNCLAVYITYIYLVLTLCSIFQVFSRCYALGCIKSINYCYNSLFF